VADAVIDDKSLVTAEKIQAAWAAAGHPDVEVSTSSRYRIFLTTPGKQSEYLMLEHALGALMRLRPEESDPHCLIYTSLDEPIGCCPWSARNEVLAEEPGARFEPVDTTDCPICKKEF
jgi:hypothetical protein